MSHKLLLRTLLLSCVLLATVVALAAPSATGTATGTPTVTIQTYLQPDLSLKTVLVISSFQPADKAGAFFGRTCRCSCGQPCKTDADCGGNVCAPGISCCNRSPQDSSWLNTSSSRKHAAPVFAAKCN